MFQFDIAALLITGVVIFFYFKKKNIATFQNRVFLMILCCCEINTVLDLLLTAQILMGFYLPVSVLWILNQLTYLLTNFFGVLIATYSLAIARLFEIESKRIVRLYTVLLTVPFSLVLLEIILSPVSYYFLNYPLVFYLDEAGNYFRGNSFFYYFLYIDCVYYVVLSFAILAKFKKRVKSEHVWLLSGYVLFVVLTIVLQFFFPELLVECFGVSLASLVFMFYIQRPEEVLDGVTDCFNQTAFARLVTQQISSSENLTCISVILDDTYFLTNTFGISQLDLFMRGVVDFLKQNFKAKDVYHIHSGCFCVVLQNATAEEVQNSIGKIQGRFNQIWDYDSIHIKLYSRLCVVSCPKDAKTAEEVIDIINLVTSDERYKQSVVKASEIDMEYKRRTMYIDHAVRLGLTDNRLEVYYQPIWSTKEQRLIGAEALIRLRDDDGNFISPEDFIPIAEKNGSILRIGEFVFESVCRTLSAIDVRKYGISKIDINLSVAQCMQEILAEQILTIRSMYNIPASLINLEITETAAAHTPEILLKNMQHLSDAGFELSLDDYGSGYSNMNYMLNLPFKMIKIDKYIVWSAFEEERSNVALTATVQMIRKLGMTVLAEGVETKAQAEWLTELGCDYLQGYYYSKPCPREQYLKIMEEDYQCFVKKHPELAQEEELDLLPEELEPVDE